MSGRVRGGEASWPSSVTLRPSSTALAGLLGVSLGVLGWLSAQAATFGVAEHTHLTAQGVTTTHRHEYAAPLAATAGVVALLAVLLLLLVHLTAKHASKGRPDLVNASASPAGIVGRFSPAVAASLFVLVETVEFAGSGTPRSVAVAVLAAGAGVQVLVAHAASVLSDAVVHGLERSSSLPVATATVPRVPASTRVAARNSSAQGAPVLAWGCRAPPARHRAFAPSP